MNPLYVPDEDIAAHHRKEWVEDSGVDPAIVDLNVRSYHGRAVHELLLGDALDTLGAHGKQYATGPLRKLLDNRDNLEQGGWWCEGVDLQNGCKSPCGWGVFKPDQPRIKKNGKEAKYEHPPHKAERVVALRVPGDPDYWAKIKADPSVDIVIDESGGKKPGAWLTAGIPALGIPGIYAGTPPIDADDPEPTEGFGYGNTNPQGQFIYVPKERQLHPDLAIMAPGRRFIISFDYEESQSGTQNRDRAVAVLVEKLYKAGAAEVAIAHREGPEKGADDLLIAQGSDALHDLIATAETVNRGPIAPIYLPQAAKNLTGDRDRADLLADHIAGRLYAAREAAARLGQVVIPVLDHLVDTPGTGKSHITPELGPRLLETQQVDRVIYVSSTYRSPSIPELNRWFFPPSRHNGLVVENIDGHQRLRRRRVTDPDDMVVEQASCQFSDNLQRLRAQGGDAQEISTFCHQQCPARVGCRYMRDHSEFLAQFNGIHQTPETLFRCSAESIPVLEKWAGKASWARTYLIFDEAPQIEGALTNSYDIPLGRFAAWGTELRATYPTEMATEAGQQLTRLLDALATLAPGDAPFGLTSQQLIKALPPAPAWSDIFGDQRILVGDGLLGLTPDSEGQHQTNQPLLLDLLLSALRTPTQHVGDVAFCRAHYDPSDKGKITLLRRRNDLRQAFLGSAGALVLDGTALTTDINAALRGHTFKADSDIAHLNAESVRLPSPLKPAHLEIVQIPDLGHLGRNRGKDIQRRLEALIPAIQDHICERFGSDAHTGVLEKSHFRSREDGHGIWFVDNQGSNAYQHDQALIMVGAPAPNLTASLTQYQVARLDHHATLNSEGFRRWYAARMGEQFVQGLHRLRPIRREGATLVLYLITSLDLKGLRITTNSKGLTFNQISSTYFTNAAAPKAQRTRESIVKAIIDLDHEGQPANKISTRKVAERVGCDAKTCRNATKGETWHEFVLDVLFDAL